MTNFKGANQSCKLQYSEVKNTYSRWDDNNFYLNSGINEILSQQAKNAFENFRNFISGGNFSCIGAKAALNGNLFRTSYYDQINAPETNAALARDLRIFAAENKDSSSNFATFAAIFGGPTINDELEWEAALWNQLENLHNLDSQSIWDPSVSSDPEDIEFSFSFSGMSFFVVGLHPESSRISRRFSQLAMVFNPHAQFDRLRETKQYERMQKTIRSREMNLQGSLNPNLGDFGTRSEARQYSGRAVEENWKCPFHARALQDKSAGE